MLDIYIKFFRHNWISEKWVMFYCAVWAVELFHFIHTFLTEIITLGEEAEEENSFWKW